MKNYGIELLRIVMCLWVVLFHYTTRYDVLYGHLSQWPVSFADGGLVAVSFFFIVSGFFVGLKMFKIEQGGLKGAAKWLALKVFKLYPAYAICLLIIFLTLSIFFLPERGNPSFLTLFSNLLFPFHPGFVFVDTAHWYLSALIVCFAFSSLLLVFPKNRRAYVLLLVTFVLYISSLGEFYAVQRVNQVFYVERLSPFFMGLVFAFYKQSFEKSYLFLMVLLLPLTIARFDSYLYGILVISLFMFVTTTFFVKNMNGWRPLVLLGGLGKFSYVWYLIHQNMGYLIIYHLERFGYSSEWVVLIPLLLTFILSILICEFLLPVVQKRIELHLGRLHI